MKTIIIALHCLNVVAGAAIASGYNAQWMGFIVAATAGLDAYLTSLLPKDTP